LELHSTGPINASGSSLAIEVTGVLDAGGSSLEIHAENPISVSGSSLELNIDSGTLELDTGDLAQKSGIISSGSYQTIWVDTYGRVVSGSSIDNNDPIVLSGSEISLKINDTLELDSGDLSQKSSVVTSGSYNTVEVDTYGRVTSGSTFDWISGSIVNEIVFRDAEELTISSGEITVTQSFCSINPESGTEDDLDTISGLNSGQFAVLKALDPGTDIITIKHGTGNISCFGASDVTLSEGIAIAVRLDSTVYVAGGGGSIDVQDEGVDLESQDYLDFRGAGISASSVSSASAIRVEVDWNQHSGTISASTVVTIPSGVGSVVVGAIEVEGELNIEGTMVVL
jgi:hypothetical protein